MNHFILWLKNDSFKAAIVSELPEAFDHARGRFVPSELYLGDVDYLRDESKRLLGFSYIVGRDNPEFEFCQRLARKSPDVKSEDGLLLLFLKQSNTYEIECIQAVGTVIYHNNADDFMLAIPDWGFGELAFDLTCEDIPKVNSTSQP